MAIKRLVVLASGRGSNFEAIANAIDSEEILNAKIVALVSNRIDAPALKIAEEKGIPAIVVPSKEFRQDGVFDREKYEQALLGNLLFLSPDFICLAGYMLILGETILNAFPGQILNIHPSLLPDYKGLRAQKQALDAGALETGCTVHFVTAGMDEGPIINQNRVDIFPGDTEESLSERLLPIEHMTYVEALSDLCNRAFKIQDDQVFFD